MQLECLSLAVGHDRKICDETAFYTMYNLNVAHKLLVIRKICDESPFYKIYNVTHLLLVIGKDVMRLPFRECAM